MSVANFSGQRLKVARNFRGLRAENLAAELGLTKQFVSYLESGKRKPTEMIVQACGDVLGFDPGYFQELGLLDEFREQDCAFQRLVSTPAFTIKRVLAHGTLFGHMVAVLESVLSLPADTVPRLVADKPEDIAAAAARCRRAWKLDADAPLKSLTRLLERAGIVVTAFKGSAEKVDAFSRGGEGHRKIVVANYDKENPLEYRWSIAHELAHLILHRPPHLATPEREKEANRFAAAFLMPRGGFSRDFPRSKSPGQLNWDGVFQLRHRWGVGIKAVIARAFELRLITPLQCQRAYKYLHAHGWHRDEADAIEHEKPELVATMFSALGDTPIGAPIELARRLNWSPKTLERVSGLPVSPLVVRMKEPRTS